MTKRPVFVKPSDTLGKVARIMAEHKIGGCPVVHNNKLVGVVTQTDLVKSIDVYQKINGRREMDLVFGLLKQKDIKPELRKAMRIKVSDVVKRGVVSIEAEHDIYKAARLINKHNVDRLPVVKNGKLVGVISKADIVKALDRINN